MLSEREPLAVRAAIVALVVALIDVAVGFGWDLTEQQYVSLTAAVGIVATAVLVVWTRGKVTPVDDPRLPEEGEGEDGDQEGA